MTRDDIVSMALLAIGAGIFSLLVNSLDICR
jgi:hypothetical protein